MAESIVRISKGLLQAQFMPYDVSIAECRDKGEYLECVVYGSGVPEGCKEVRAIVSMDRRLEPVDG